MTYIKKKDISIINSHFSEKSLFAEINRYLSECGLEGYEVKHVKIDLKRNIPVCTPPLQPVEVCKSSGICKWECA